MTDENRPTTPTADDKQNKSTTLILVRHGKTPSTGTILPGRASGLLLSDEGETQATSIIDSLKLINPIAAIYSSPLERARQTAQPLAQARTINPIIDERLYECDFGDWTGRRLDELFKLPEWKVVQSSPSKFRFPNGESFREMSNRVIDFLDFVHTEYRGETVVAFSHADPIKALVAHCLGIHLDSFQRIVISTAGISAISITDTDNYALYVNQTPNPNMKVS